MPRRTRDISENYQAASARPSRHPRLTAPHPVPPINESLFADDTSSMPAWVSLSQSFLEATQSLRKEGASERHLFAFMPFGRRRFDCAGWRRPRWGRISSEQQPTGTHQAGLRETA